MVTDIVAQSDIVQTPLFELIQETHELLQQKENLEGQYIDTIIKIGQNLNKMQSSYELYQPYGHYIHFAENEFNLSRRTIQDYRRIAAVYGSNVHRGAHLPERVLRVLSAPSTTEQVRQLVEAGQIPATPEAIRAANKARKAITTIEQWPPEENVVEGTITEVDEDEDEEKEDEPIALPTKGVQPGQWWELGRHLLYCGDSTDDTFRETCKMAEASFAFADPPYNAGVEEWDHNFVWKHDYLSKYIPIVAVTPGISAIQDFMSNTEMPYKWSMAYWIDNGMTRGALGFGNWIYVALFSAKSIYRNEQDVERIELADSERVSITGGDHDALKHKGRKPISLLRHILSLFTKQDQTVVDPFLGTGTTLIACEKEGRSCIGAEKDVEYCEHIIRRWEKEANSEAKEIEYDINAI